MILKISLANFLSIGLMAAVLYVGVRVVDMLVVGQTQHAANADA